MGNSSLPHIRMYVHQVTCARTPLKSHARSMHNVRVFAAVSLDVSSFLVPKHFWTQIDQICIYSKSRILVYRFWCAFWNLDLDLRPWPGCATLRIATRECLVCANTMYTKTWWTATHLIHYTADYYYYCYCYYYYYLARVKALKQVILNLRLISIS